MSGASSPISGNPYYHMPDVGPRGDRREYTAISPIPSDEYLICPDCGSLVVRRGVHDRWHSDHASVVDRVAYAIFHVGPPPLAPLLSWNQARRMAAAAVKALDEEAI